MQYSIKDILKMISIVMLYVLFGGLGIFSDTLIFLFPLLAIPMTLHLMSNKINIKRELILNIVIGALIYLGTGNVGEVILYTLNVIIPAYIISALYRKNIAVPQVIMYATTAISGILCVYIIILKALGIDYIAQYFELLNMYKSVQSDVLGSMSAYGIGSEQIKVLKELIEAQISILKIVYPALMFIIIMWLVVIHVSIITLLGKLRRWPIPSLRQLFQFKLSKATAVLFVIAFLLVQSTTKGGNAFNILGWNIYFLINSLYQIIGLISLIILIRRSKANKGIKVIGIIFSVSLIYISPSIVMMFGLLDTMFNYRKVKNVV